MSTKTEKTAGKTETLIDPKTVKGPGAGFEEVSSADRCVGFFILQAGNALQGILRGSFETDNRFDKNNKKRVFKIELTSADPAQSGPTLYQSANSAIAEDYPDGCPGKVGDLIGIDEKGFLQSLRGIEEGREVWIYCYGKEAPSEDFPQGAWKFKVMAKPAPAASSQG